MYTMLCCVVIRIQHLKATMMKVSDPIMFGHCVKVYFRAAFEKHAELFQEIGVNPNNGLASVFQTVQKKCSPDVAKMVIADIEACYEDRPWLAMVNSDKGITNLVRFRGSNCAKRNRIHQLILYTCVFSHCMPTFHSL
jgi:monomeric type NADP-dependent isocitrate dehydrogenase